MVEAFKFTYKDSNMFKNIQPSGLAVYGQNGKKGVDGTTGTTLYFVNYLTLTGSESSQNVNNILNCIQNNYVLNDNSLMDSIYTQNVREYRDGDLIICKKANKLTQTNEIYKIRKTINDNGRIFYGLEKLGYIETNKKIKTVSDTVKSYGLGEMESITTECAVPVNRSYEISDDSSISYINMLGKIVPVDSSENIETDYADALRTLFCIKFEPYINITDEINVDLYDFYLKIYIKNEKSILGKNFLGIKKGVTDVTDPDDPSFFTEPVLSNDNYNIIKFSKVIEIPLNKYIDSSLIGRRHKPTVISDMVCDKLHPSQNNFSNSFFDPYRNRGYITRTVFGNSTNPLHAYLFKKEQNPLHNNNTEYYIYGRSFGGDSSVDSSIKDACIFEKMSGNKFPFHQTYEQSSSFLQYSKHRGNEDSSVDCIINFRSGESAYFSGLIYDKKFDSSCLPIIGAQPGIIDSNQYSDEIDYMNNIGSLSGCIFDQYVASQRILNKNHKEYKYSPFFDDVSVYDTSTIFNNRIEAVKEYVTSEIKDFLFNDKNSYELIYVNKTSGRTLTQTISLNDLKTN